MYSQTNKKTPKMLKMSEMLLSLIDIGILLSCLYAILYTNNTTSSLPIIGCAIIGLSLYLCYKVRLNEKLLFLFAIIGFINISIGITDGINKGYMVADWQIPLRESEYNLYTSKSILLFLSILNLMLSSTWIKFSEKVSNPIKINRENNIFIGYIGSAILFGILILGYSSDMMSTNSYVSNSNPLVEYAVIIFAVVWLFSGENVKLNFILNFYALFYIIYTMYFGDRSAAFLMILLYYLLNSKSDKKLSITKLLFLSIVAITFSNIIAEYRIGFSSDLFSLVNNVIQRGLYSDTVSYSYYASITISAVYHLDNTFVFFVEYLKTLIMGGGSSGYGNLANFVKENFMHNVGGGLYTSYFYFGLGYFGVVLGSIILGFILRLVYSRSGFFTDIYQILIPILSIRWYLYGPTSLFRSVFLITTLLLLVCVTFHKLTKKTNI